MDFFDEVRGVTPLEVAVLAMLFTAAAVGAIVMSIVSSRRGMQALQYDVQAQTRRSAC